MWAGVLCIRLMQHLDIFLFILHYHCLLRRAVILSLPRLPYRLSLSSSFSHLGPILFCIERDAWVRAFRWRIVLRLRSMLAIEHRQAAGLATTTGLVFLRNLLPCSRRILFSHRTS